MNVYETQPTEARYEVTLAGIPVGRGGWTIEIADDQFDAITSQVEKDLVKIGRCAHTNRLTSRFVNCLHDPCHELFLLSEEAELENRDFLLCPECRNAGLTDENSWMIMAAEM